MSIRPAIPAASWTAQVQCSSATRSSDIDLGLRIESKYFGKLLAHPVARNLARTPFINKGAADKLMTRPKNLPKSIVSTLGVLGAGLMGAGIAYVAARAGIDVVLLDASQEQADKSKTGIAALKRAFPPAAQQPDVYEVKARLLTIMALESARCFEDGVVTNAIDADLGSILGIGYPSWTGGTLSYIDTLGARPFVAECKRLATLYGRRFEPSAWLLERADRNESFYARVDAA